jgi:hypothetical protein
MKKLLRFLALIGLSILLYSCPMAPVAGVSSGGGASSDGAPSGGSQPASLTPSIKTDAARNQAVYVDEKGTSIDITAQEPDGTVVPATQGVGLALLSDAGAGARTAGSQDGDQPRALVIGMRADGRAGAWVVLKNGTVLPAADDSSGHGTSLLPDCDDRDHGLRGWFGWKYLVTGISSDGLMIVGNATNEKGFRFGMVKIDPGTTVGVYWRVRKISHRPHVIIEGARVIGTLDTKPPKKGHRSRWLDALRLSRLPGLQLFFLNYFSAYLVSADAVSKDSTGTLYIVTGTDQDGNDATAAIDAFNRIVITPTTPPVGQADLKVTSVQVPSTAQTTAATWTLAATVTNSGTADAGATTLLYQVSTSNVLDSSATTIGTSAIPALAVGASYTDTFSTSFSISQPGTHWIYVTADSTNAVAESNESNNTSSASVPIIYGLVVIDTYYPKAGAQVSAVDTWLSLFGASADTTVNAPNIWNNDTPPYTTETSAIAENGSLGNYGRITYSGGLAPGTYYIRVRGVQSVMNGAYAIRVLSTAADSPSGSSWPWYFTATNPTDANPAGGSYEVDDNPLQGGVPTNPVTISLGGKLNRWLTAGKITAATPVPGDVDWFKLVLP